MTESMLIKFTWDNITKTSITTADVCHKGIVYIQPEENKPIEAKRIIALPFKEKAIGAIIPLVETVFTCTECSHQSIGSFIDPITLPRIHGKFVCPTCLDLGKEVPLTRHINSPRVSDKLKEKFNNFDTPLFWPCTLPRVWSITTNKRRHTTLIADAQEIHLRNYYNQYILPYNLHHTSERGSVISLPVELNRVPIEALTGGPQAEESPGRKRGWLLSVLSDEHKYTQGEPISFYDIPVASAIAETSNLTIM